VTEASRNEKGDQRSQALISPTDQGGETRGVRHINLRRARAVGDGNGRKGGKTSGGPAKSTEAFKEQRQRFLFPVTSVRRFGG